MKKIAALMMCIGLSISLVACSGSEINFKATILEIDGNTAVANVTEDDTNTLPEQITFNTDGLDENFKVGDRQPLFMVRL